MIRMTLEEVMARPISARQKARMERLKNIRDEDIDFSDCPEMTEEDFASGKLRIIRHGGARPGAGRKPVGTKATMLWLTPAASKRLRTIAKKEGITMSKVANRLIEQGVF